MQEYHQLEGDTSHLVNSGWAVLTLIDTLPVQEYHQLEGDTSHVVNTGWAVLALIAAGYHKKDRGPIDAGVRFLMNSQLSNGDWPQQHISGVFNRNCMITYANYRSACIQMHDGFCCKIGDVRDIIHGMVHSTCMITYANYRPKDMHTPRHSYTEAQGISATA